LPPLATIPRRAVVRAAKLGLRAGYGDRPVPLDRILKLQAFARDPESMPYRRSRSVYSTGAALHDPFLAGRLAHVELGNWTVAAATMNYLEQAVRRARPSLVLEFGSGISTACFARYLGEGGGVLSLEQSEEQREATASLVDSLGLSDAAEVIHAPLVPHVLEGTATLSYAIPTDVYDRVGSSERVFVFVDGPGIGDRMGRFAALVLIRPYLAPGTPFYLDDALRSYGLDAMRAWGRLPGFVVDGVSFVGHGLGAGRIAAQMLSRPESAAGRRSA
jgi:predicted O-methyltransferase YrrM